MNTEKFYNFLVLIEIGYDMGFFRGDVNFDYSRRHKIRSDIV